MSVEYIKLPQHTYKVVEISQDKVVIESTIDPSDKYSFEDLFPCVGCDMYVFVPIENFLSRAGTALVTKLFSDYKLQEVRFIDRKYAGLCFFLGSFFDYNQAHIIKEIEKLAQKIYRLMESTFEIDEVGYDFGIVNPSFGLPDRIGISIQGNKYDVTSKDVFGYHEAYSFIYKLYERSDKCRSFKVGRTFETMECGVLKILFFNKLNSFTVHIIDDEVIQYLVTDYKESTDLQIMYLQHNIAIVDHKLIVLDSHSKIVHKMKLDDYEMLRYLPVLHTLSISDIKKLKDFKDICLSFM